MSEQISITRALVEVKTLDDRIKKAIATQTFVSLSKGIKKAVPIKGEFKDIDEVKASIESSNKSISDLIERRSTIKAAVSKANVEVMVTVGGKEMNISSAIDLKVVVGYKSLILDQMVRQLAMASNNVETNRLQMETAVQNSIQGLLGADAKTKSGVEQNAALIQSTKDSIFDMLGLQLIDPLDVKAKIIELRKEIADIVNEIDFVLSEANASNKISV